jgi:hypothetical protein
MDNIKAYVETLRGSYSITGDGVASLKLDTLKDNKSLQSTIDKLSKVDVSVKSHQRNKSK